MTNLQLRAATLEDAESVWVINNHPSVRAVAFSTQDIPLDDHLVWFHRVLEAAEHRVFVTCCAGKVVAIVRFEQSSSSLGEISIAVSEKARGQGVGKWSLSEAGRSYFHSRPEITAIRAYIKIDNLASQKAFRSAGYELVGEDHVKGAQVYVYRLERNTQ